MAAVCEKDDLFFGKESSFVFSRGVSLNLFDFPNKFVFETFKEIFQAGFIFCHKYDHKYDHMYVYDMTFRNMDSKCYASFEAT